MFQLLIIVTNIISVFSDIRSFLPSPRVGLHNTNRIWMHANQNCFPQDSDIRTFKDYLLENYPCITFDMTRPQIYNFATETDNFWSLWLEKNSGFNDVNCLDTPIELPTNILSACIDYVTYEPISTINQYTTNEYDCTDKSAPRRLWSLDILDGNFYDNKYDYPYWGDLDNVEVIVLDTQIYTGHTEFSESDPERLPASPGVSGHGVLENNPHPPKPYPGYPGPPRTTATGPPFFPTSIIPGTPIPGPHFPPLGDFAIAGPHGTHVAATIVGKTVGGAKKTKLWYYPACNKRAECGNRQIEQAHYSAILHMMTHASKRYVVNYSVGVVTENDQVRRWFNSIAKSITEAGGIYVVAAGNDGIDACYGAPAFSEWAITVGAYDYNRERASSNWGSCVDVYGPGVDIYSAVPGDNNYANMTGTSMATPNIASIVVNYLKWMPRLRLWQIKEYLTYYARCKEDPAWFRAIPARDPWTREIVYDSDGNPLTIPQAQSIVVLNMTQSYLPFCGGSGTSQRDRCRSPPWFRSHGY